MQPRLRLAVAQAKYCNSFQLTHMPRGNHDVSNGDQKEDKTLLQHSQLRQQGEFWHASVSERQQSRPCGQNLRVPFLRKVLRPEVEESTRAMAATARQKRSYLHHQGEFQHQLFTFRSGHDSDHGSVVRIFVGQSQVLKHYVYYLYRGATALLVTVATPRWPRRSTS